MFWDEGIALMTIIFNANMLREAVIRADSLELRVLSETHPIEYEFSKKFERKMNKLIRQNQQEKPIKGISPVCKRAVAVVAVVTILLASTMGVSAVRYKVFEYVAEVYEKFTHIFFEESLENWSMHEKFVVFRPTYIVDGFELVTEIDENLVLLIYEMDTDYIIFSQDRLQGVSLHINTEGVELEEFKFNGLPAKYYSNRGIQNLLWYDEKYLYTISSTLDRDIIFEIAESVEVVRTDIIP